MQSGMSWAGQAHGKEKLGTALAEERLADEMIPKLSPEETGGSKTGRQGKEV